VALVRLVDVVVPAVAVDVDRVDAEVVVRGGADLYPAQPVEPAVHERRLAHRAAVVQDAPRVAQREAERMAEHVGHGAKHARPRRRGPSTAR
jgi:hypothetical protein